MREKKWFQVIYTTSKGKGPLNGYTLAHSADWAKRNFKATVPGGVASFVSEWPGQEPPEGYKIFTDIDDTPSDRRLIEMVRAAVRAAAANLMYLDRKGDEDLTLDRSDYAWATDLVDVDTMTDIFRQELRDRVERIKRNYKG